MCVYSALREGVLMMRRKKMLVLTNQNAQTVPAGANVRFQDVVMETGRASAHRKNSGVVTLVERGLYELIFKANVGGYPSTKARLAIAMGGEVLPETAMESTVRDDFDEQCVFAMTVVRHVAGCDTVSVVCDGESPVCVMDPCLIVKHVR